MALEPERVLPDEQRLMPLESEHHVAGAVAGDAEIGVDRDDRRVPEGSRLRIPACVERRIEMEAVTGDLDGGNRRLGRMGRREGEFGHAGLSLGRGHELNCAANSSSSELAAATVRRAAT